MKPALNTVLLKKLALGLLGVLTALLLFLWLALPRILQSQAEKFVAAQTGHRLEMARPEFNPFTLSLRLANLKLAESDGQPLLAFDTLLVDVSIASLPRRGLVFDVIRLDGLQLTLVERAEGGINWTPFLDALKSKEAAPAAASPLPRFEVASLVLAGGHVDFADRRSVPGFATRVEPVDFSLSDISTQPDDSGKFSFSARTAFGAQLRLQGDLTLNPLGVAGDIALDDLELGQLATYLKNGLPGAPAGKVSLAARYRAGNHGQRLNALVEDIAVKVADLRVPLAADGAAAMHVASIDLTGGRFELANQSLKLDRLAIAGGKLELPGVKASPTFGALTLENLDVALAERKASLGRVAFLDGRVQAVRNAQGKVDLQEALQAIVAAQPKEGKPAAPANAPAVPPAPAWRYQVGKIELAGWGLAVRDESLGQPVELALEKLAFTATGLSDDLKAALPVSLGFDVAMGGRFASAGKVVPAEAAADFQLKLADLSLKPAQPLLATKTTLRIADGTLATEGRLVVNAKGPDFRGQFDLRNLRIVEDDGDTLLAWKSFAGQKLAATASRLDIGELRLNGLDTKLIIEKDKSINFKSALKSEPTPASSAVPPVPRGFPAVTSTSGIAAPFVINIDRVRFYNGALFFADHSLVLPFGTRIHSLRGSLSNLSNRSGGAPGQLELEGEVDDYGMARAVGQFNLFDPTGFMDIRVLFRNVEMTRLTPYTATFAGRKIDSGKLSLDLQYKLKQRQMQGENQVTIERLTLGERIESPEAADLPLDLAIAILQDSDGRIDLGLPVAGSLDDPEFSYGAIVWKAIRNVLTKIVTAPFRALGALFGGSGEQVEGIVFEAGAATLTPPEREKLVRIAQVLAKRPRLQLTLGGMHAEADRVALQDLQLRRTVLTRLGERVNEKYDPGPLSTAQPKTRGVLEDLYAERFGASDLAALKEGFRRANPGQLEEGVAGKMMSRLSGLLREKKTLSDDEVAQLKGGDFHAFLFERLRTKEAVGDEPLRELGKARAEYAFQTLKAAGAAVERMQQAAPESGDSTAGGVPLKLALAAKQSK